VGATTCASQKRSYTGADETPANEIRGYNRPANEIRGYNWWTALTMRSVIFVAKSALDYKMHRTVGHLMDFLMRRGFFFLALLAALASGCGRKPTGEEEFARGLAEYKDGKYEKAAADFESALAVMQTNALALNFLGVCRLQQGDTEMGLRDLQNAVRLDPAYFPARYNLALAQLERGQGQEAVANLRAVVQNSSAPADSYYRLGLAYMRVAASEKNSGQAWSQAEEAFKHYLPGNSNPAETLNCLGIVAARKRDYLASKRWFEQCIAAEPGFATAYLNLANLENQQGQKKEALAHYETYIDLFARTQPREDVRLAMLQVRQDLSAAAKQPARAPEPASPPPAPPPTPPSPKPAAPPQPVAAPKPSPPPPAPVETATVVSAVAAQPQPPPAPRKVRTAIATRTLKPGNRNKALVFFNQGAYLQRQGKATDAISEYTRAAAADPSYSRIYYNLAIAYNSIGQPERALDNYELALMADPNYADARFNYALGLQTSGYIDDAITQYKKILAANPNDAATHLLIGGLYARDRATYPQAREQYQQFLKLSPDTRIARETRHWLDQNP
jgi:tetratricopeptide (TPR) repeat protein